MHGLILCIVLFLCIGISCNNTTIWNIPIKTIQNSMSVGDYSFLDNIPIDKIQQIAKITSGTPYYAGLYLLDSGNHERASAVFTAGAKKSPAPYNRLCARLLPEALCNAANCINTAESYCKKWPQDIPATTHLFDVYCRTGNYSQIQQIAVQQGIPELIEKASIAKVFPADIEYPESIYSQVADYITALANRNSGILSEREKTQLMTVLMYCPVTNSYCRAVTAVQTVGADITASVLAISQARCLVFQKDYRKAASVFAVLIKEAGSAEFSQQVLSDAGKAFLYGAESKESFAIWQRLPESFMQSFYCGRFAAKAGFTKEAIDFFQTAISTAPTDYQKDSAVWYQLDVASKINSQIVFELLLQNQQIIQKRSYFADFFESFISKLARNGEWNTIASLYYQLGYAVDEETEARLAYITARGLESGKITLLPNEIQLIADNSNTILQEVVTRAYMHAYLANHKTFYYRMMAARRLGQKDETAALFKVSKQPITKNTAYLQRNPNSASAKTLLTTIEYIDGCLAHGLKNRAFQAIIDYGTEITTADLLSYSRLYRDKYNDYQKSIRIAVEALSMPDHTLSKKEIELAYPFLYRPEITEACSTFNIPESLLCGLIRTESYFNKDIVSFAGAIGLAQLMETTAADVAQKLKHQNYILTDAKTNIVFGAYYLSELIYRLDGNIQDALFSYNAGINRVRRWHVETPSLDDDLFLETIPIEETRDYGRKVLAAATLYRYLYDTTIKE